MTYVNVKRTDIALFRAMAAKPSGADPRYVARGEDLVASGAIATAATALAPPLRERSVTRCQDGHTRGKPSWYGAIADATGVVA
jgi:hypothetical protein